MTKKIKQKFSVTLVRLENTTSQTKTPTDTIAELLSDGFEIKLVIPGYAGGNTQCASHLLMVKKH